jgi:Lon protease-like protein
MPSRQRISVDLPAPLRPSRPTTRPTGTSQSSSRSTSIWSKRFESARIVDFTQLPDGLLGITARGEEVFTVSNTRVGESNLLIGEVAMRGADAAVPVPAEYALLATLLERLASQMGGELGTAPKAKFDDAAWVAYRLAELLPLEHVDRLELLAEADPVARLGKLAEWLPRFQRE